MHSGGPKNVFGVDTKPEMIVRRFLFSKGLRYRLHYSGLPGKPDIVFTRRKVAVFVNGCFWHQHEGCRKAKRPKSNTDFWNKKLDANILRDQRTSEKLKGLGWIALVIWECEISRKDKLNALYENIISTK